MNSSDFVIDTNLSMVDYVIIVENIASEYFDEDGEYVPHYGDINAMRLFYNLCVKQCDFDEKYPHNITDILNMEEIMRDETFVLEFNDAICAYRKELNFGSAYLDAMNIVDYKKNSVSQIVTQIKSLLRPLINNINDIVSTGAIDEIKSIFEKFGNGDNLSDLIIDSYKNSSSFKNLTKK